MDQTFWTAELRAARVLEQEAFDVFLSNPSSDALTHWQDASVVSVCAARQMWDVIGLCGTESVRRTS